MELLYQAHNIRITRDPETNILICTWIGQQKEKELREAGTKIRDLLVTYKCTKILNDNTQVIGTWNHSTQWASKEWFPKIISAGLKRFAWVLATDSVAQVSMYWVSPGINLVKTFISKEDAMEWLTEED